MDKNELIGLAKTELHKLKEHATEEELKNLLDHRAELTPNWPTTCIYGLMTGSCYSPRAERLMEECSPVFFSSLRTEGQDHTFPVIRTGIQVIGRHWSALEVALDRYFLDVKELLGELDHERA